jgi:gluconate 2-dehydrogenase alpha chain
MDELRSPTIRNEWGVLKFNKEFPTWRPNAQTPTQPVTPTSQPMPNGVGSATAIYGAVSLRCNPNDFRVRTDTVQRYGPSALPPGTDITDWPLGYDDLEPYYDAVERLIGVSGQAGNVRGRILAGGNPFEGPRAHPYPLPPLRASGLGELFREVTTKAGYHPFPVPAAILSEPYEGRQACTYCSFCSGMPCHVEAKGDVRLTVLPRALATGNLEIRTGCVALEVVVDDHGEVTGVEYQGPDGRVVQPCGVVMLAAYTFENVRLLLLSRSRHFPSGVGNNANQVGRYYMSRQHPYVFALFEGRQLNRFTGPFAQGVTIDDLNSNNFDHTGLGFIRGGRMWAGNAPPPIGASGAIPPGVPRWGASYKEFLCRSSNSTAEIGFNLEMLPYDANFLDLDPVTRDSWGRPVVRITLDNYDNERRAVAFLQERASELFRLMGANRVWRLPLGACAVSQHDLGGARMGADPNRSVVNGIGQVHGAPRLFVLGGATFPTQPGFNPTLTIQALALRTAAHIAEAAPQRTGPHAGRVA